jgi:hypothetical protein
VGPCLIPPVCTECACLTSANCSGPDLARHSDEWPDMGQSGQPESIRSNLARLRHINNLGTIFFPGVRLTGKILCAYTDIRPDLLVLFD